MTLPMKILKFLGLIGLLATLAGIGAAAFFFGGFFSVAANHPDPYMVNWALVQVRKASITRHATDQPPGSLDDPAMVREGARAYFQRGCTNCHGGPGVEPADFSAGLNPQPNLNRVEPAGNAYTVAQPPIRRQCCFKALDFLTQHVPSAGAHQSECLLQRLAQILPLAREIIQRNHRADAFSFTSARNSE